jgi:hypothetical protein
MTRHALRYRMQKLNMKITGETGESIPSGNTE